MILSQFVFNSLTTGSIYALIALGFSLVYLVMRFFNFAHGGLIAISAYVFYMFINFLRVDFITAVVLTLLFSTIIGFVLNQFVYRKLRFKKATGTMLILVSFILLVFLGGLLSLVFGNDVKLTFTSSSQVINLLGGKIDYQQIALVLVSLITFLSTLILIKYTKVGKQMRATSDNRELAEVSGINTEKIYKYTLVISSLIAAIGGIVVSLESSLRPTIGNNLIIKGFTGSVVGGLSSIVGAVVGGYLIGFLENVSVLILPSGYKDGITFLLLFLFLIFRPKGIFGD